ncbi:hypothetical protein [Flavobacterium sandaracinum]|uniref:Uncharacterized protein n=1 Tax=Flavobacterium sandaracinum TaxID=2541733 RepID=A0A4R5CUS3_9FLAO|nr:hypothetical protein [Flavobacterium sandaracinum]TDE01513.1 hypothetical protein E0F91_14255 [Flavobacterium sandaracinum]
MKNTSKIDYKEIDKYRKTDIEYYDLLNRVCHIGFRTSDFDFWVLFNEAEKQGKKIYLVRDRWNELFKENPSIDWEDQIYKEDVGIK